MTPSSAPHAVSLFTLFFWSVIGMPSVVPSMLSFFWNHMVWRNRAAAGAVCAQTPVRAHKHGTMAGPFAHNRPGRGRSFWHFWLGIGLCARDRAHATGTRHRPWPWSVPDAFFTFCVPSFGLCACSPTFTRELCLLLFFVFVLHSVFFSILLVLFFNFADVGYLRATNNDQQKTKPSLQKCKKKRLTYLACRRRRHFLLVTGHPTCKRRKKAGGFVVAPDERSTRLKK